MRLAGLDPDPWQTKVLQSQSLRMLFLCSRQSGKSTTAAALALRTAITERDSLVLLLSRTLRQSGELFRDKVLRQWRRMGCPLAVGKPTQLELTLSNESRIISLPESEEGIRGFSSVRMLIVDEAARVGDDLYRAVRPMLAVSNGRLVALSTAFGQRGWFFDAWEKGDGWERIRITADECPRISTTFLAEERKAIGDRWYRQEYFCSFEDAVGAVFSHADIHAAMADIAPLFREDG